MRIFAGSVRFSKHRAKNERILDDHFCNLNGYQGSNPPVLANAMFNPLCRVCAALLPFWFNAVLANDLPADPERIYQESCSVCHGDDGRGAVWGHASLSTPPRDFSTAASRRELSRARMIASVTYGRPGTPMPGFGTQLSVDEITDVVDFIRRSFMRFEAQAAEKAERLAAMPHEQAGRSEIVPAIHDTGDVEHGRALYTKNCVDCHGIDGDGNGPRAHFIFPKPRNFLDDEVRRTLSRHRLFSGIKFGITGREMPAWGKVLSDEEIADVTAFVYQRFILTDASTEPNY